MRGSRGPQVGEFSNHLGPFRVCQSTLLEKCACDPEDQSHSLRFRAVSPDASRAFWSHYVKDHRGDDKVL